MLWFRISFVTSVLFPAFLTAYGSGDDASPTRIGATPTTINGSTVVPVTPVDKPPTIPAGAQAEFTVPGIWVQ